MYPPKDCCVLKLKSLRLVLDQFRIFLMAEKLSLKLSFTQYSPKYENDFHSMRYFYCDKKSEKDLSHAEQWHSHIAL